MNDDAVRIFVVDDEPDVTRGLSWLLQSVDLPTEMFNHGEAFLARLHEHAGPACSILALNMPGGSGLDLMQAGLECRPDIPTIFLSDHSDVPSAVLAMKLGAFDFLVKPFPPQQFLDCINRALERAVALHGEWLRQRDTRQNVMRLSAREREVLEQMLGGLSAKEIGRALKISPKTVDVHRAHVMRKLGVSSARELTSRFRMAKLPKET